MLNVTAQQLMNIMAMGFIWLTFISAFITWVLIDANTQLRRLSAVAERVVAFEAAQVQGSKPAVALDISKDDTQDELSMQIRPPALVS